MNIASTKRRSERGSAGTNFLITLMIIVLVANAGINYLPVAYEAESLKAEMYSAVMQGLALPGRVNPAENVKTRIRKAAAANEAPENALIDVKSSGNSITARVYYIKNINLLPFGIYKYNYVFDHTVTPTGFLLKQ